MQIGERLSSAHGFVLALLLLFVGLSAKYSRKAFHNRSAVNRWLPQSWNGKRAGHLATVQLPKSTDHGRSPEPLAQMPPVVPLSPGSTSKRAWPC